VARVFRLLALAAVTTWLIPAQESKQPAPKPAEQELPEEDESIKSKEYSFNPLQAEQEFKVGNFYWKKGSWKAAAMRYEEATMWNPGFTEAFLKLGEAYEKLKKKDEARDAYGKFLELESDSKRAADIRKRMTKLK
jgi:outer membrane protein assembly factor BamD (BamD/ComL family)